MKRIRNLTDEPHQVHVILYQQSEINLELRFFPIIERWYFSLEYDGSRVENVPLSLGTLHIQSKNMPFDFAVAESSGLDLDPFRLDDWEERCQLYLIEESDG